MDAYSCRLAGEALLHIVGPDTLTFLQGQTTCDTRELAPKRSLPGVYCTPQGRVVCDFLLSELASEHVALRMGADILEHAAGVLGKYVVFSKADIDIQRDDWQVFACWGADAGEVVQSVIGERPEQRWSASRANHAVAVQLDEAGQSFECYIDTHQAPELAEALLAATDEGEESRWRALQVRDGIARIENATVEEFVPQSVNYDLTGHISFTKGCYTGQEVVARLHYRGTPKRRAYVAALPAGTSASAGDKLFAKDTGKNVGDIVNIAEDGEQLLVLASATAEGMEAGLQVGDTEGAELQSFAQPYSLEKD